MGAGVRLFDRSQFHRRASKGIKRPVSFIDLQCIEQIRPRLVALRQFPERILVISRFVDPIKALLGEFNVPPHQVTYFDIGRQGFSSVESIAKEQRQDSVDPDEGCLPFQIGLFDLIISHLDLHWINRVEVVLEQTRHLLKPGGLYISTCFGGATLQELRQAFVLADSEGPLGVTPRICEFMELRTCARFMYQMGFKDSVVDRSQMEVCYESVEDLLEDLKLMGETSIMNRRPSGLTVSDAFRRLKKHYPQDLTHPQKAIKATFELFYLTGWG